MSEMAFRFTASSTTIQCQPCEFDPVGACNAICKHSSTTDRSTGRSKSSRLRTDRVVVSTSSAERLSFMAAAWHGDGRLVVVDEYAFVNRANWESRVAHHLKGYGIEKF